MAFVRNPFVVCFCGFTVFLVCSNALAIQSVKLSSGHEMPIIGLGTWQIQPEVADVAVSAALDSGYRHIDTAFLYENEEAIGESLKKWFNNGGKREDLFITTKLPFYGNRASDVEMFLTMSLNKLGLEYVDMYLIHSPVGFMRNQSDGFDFLINPNGTFALDLDTDHISLWKAMEDQVKAGRARSIGLSNFNESQITNIIDHAEIKPSNLQIELQLYNQQKPMREFCKKHDIAITAYSSLGSPATLEFIKTEEFVELPKSLENPTVVSIAAARNKTAAQVLLRHQVQHGIIVIPKSQNPDYIKENINIFNFELTDEEMKQLDDLDLGEKGRMLDFLAFEGVENHPHYPFTQRLSKKDQSSTTETHM